MNALYEKLAAMISNVIRNEMRMLFAAAVILAPSVVKAELADNTEIFPMVNDSGSVFGVSINENAVKHVAIEVVVPLEDVKLWSEGFSHRSAGLDGSADTIVAKQKERTKTGDKNGARNTPKVTDDEFDHFFYWAIIFAALWSLFFSSSPDNRIP